MQRDRRKFLWDASEAAGAIAEFTGDKTFSDYTRDRMLRSAVERQLETISLGNV